MMRIKITAPNSLLSVVLDREVTEAQADAVLDLLNAEWCLHDGSYTCPHAAQHNAIYGSDSPAGAGESVEAFRG